MALYQEQYSGDLAAIHELYESVEKTTKKKSAKNQAHEAEDSILEGANTAIDILNGADAAGKSGIDRDVSEIAEAMDIFPKLKELLAQSGRSSNSKYMQPVMKALDDYLAVDGIKIHTKKLNQAQHISGEEAKKAAIKNAKDEAFDDVISLTMEKMHAFIGAADNYISERIEKWNNAWTEAGKQRRALVRAAKVQMQDQLMHLINSKQMLYDNIGILLEQADNAGKNAITFQASNLVETLIREKMEKQNSSDIEAQAKDIAMKIAADDRFAKNGDNIRKANVVGELFNQGKTDKDKENFDPAKLYAKYQEIKSKRPQTLTTSADVLLSSRRGEIKTVLPESADLKNQKAKICSMFYLMTGKEAEPEFIYLWKMLKPVEAAETPNSAELIRVFPLSVPTFEKEGNMEPKPFVDKMRSRYGPAALNDLDFMKFVNGEATANTDLNKEDAEIWKNLARDLAGKGGGADVTKEEMADANIIRARYLGLQNAIGTAPPPPELLEH